MELVAEENQEVISNTIENVENETHSTAKFFFAETPTIEETKTIEKPRTGKDLLEFYKSDTTQNERFFVYRFTNFENDAREDFAASKILEGSITFNSELDLESEIEKRFGGGHYLAQLRVSGKPNGQVVFHIAGEPKTILKPETTTTQPQIVVSQANPFEGVEQSFSFFERLMKLSPKITQVPIAERRSLRDELLEAKDLVEMITPAKSDVPVTGKTVWDFAESIGAGIVQNLPAIIQAAGLGQNLGSQNLDLSQYTAVKPSNKIVSEILQNPAETISVEEPEIDMMEFLRRKGTEMLFEFFEKIGESDDATEAVAILEKHLNMFPMLQIGIKQYLEMDNDKLIALLREDETTAHFADIPDLLGKLAKIKKELK